jgi:hypothetical protein
MGFDNLYENVNTTFDIKYGVVVELESNLGPLSNKGVGRLKARIKGSISTGGDDGLNDEELAWCFPMLPKHFSVQPKKGEVVIIFTFSKQQQHADRLYIGPIISQLPKLDKDDYLTALAGFTFGPTQPNVSTNQIPELNGVFGKTDDVIINGRYNTDLIQRKNEVIIRAGKFVTQPVTEKNPYGIAFNSSTQAYIQIKNDAIISPKSSEKPEQFGSVTNIVSNKINLLTHSDGNPRFNLTDPESLISQEELEKILSEAHQIPFGDVLLEYLILLKNAFFAHVHNGSGNPPTDLTISGNKQALAAFKAKAEALEKAMLSRNIRIN